MTPSEQRFVDSLEPQANGCWDVPGYKTIFGYSKGFIVGYRTRFAHRLAYEVLIGPIPDGLDLDHLCRNRWCVNPDHLEPVTRKENIRRSPLLGAVKRGGRPPGRGNQRDITHCPADHPYDEKNTYIQPNGGRACRACAVARVLRRRDEQRASGARN